MVVLDDSWLDEAFYGLHYRDLSLCLVLAAIWILYSVGPLHVDDIVWPGVDCSRAQSQVCILLGSGASRLNVRSHRVASFLKTDVVKVLVQTLLARVVHVDATDW